MEITDSVKQQLIAAARDAAGRAYCPYSRFRVGAAVLTGSGEVHSGCNVENASYGLTICAERNAIFHAAAVSGAGLEVRMIVVYTPTPEPTAPCGACRQVINEFGPEAEVLCVCDGPTVIAQRLSDLLPAAFGPANLA